MKKVLLAICLITLFWSCNAQNSKKTGLEIQVKDLKQLDKNDFDEKEGIFYSANIDLLNNTDSIFRFWAWNCDWQENWAVSEDSIELYNEGCDKNFLFVNEIYPGQSLTYIATIKISCKLESIKGKDIKLGFVLIKENEYEMSWDAGVDKMNEFLRLVYDKCDKGKDVFWSNSFKIN